MSVYSVLMLLVQEEEEQIEKEMIETAVKRSLQDDVECQGMGMKDIVCPTHSVTPGQLIM